jgi:hypothetical protein
MAVSSATICPGPSGFDADTRRRLAKMCLRLLELWGLNRRQQAIMLGLSPETRSTLRRFAQGAPLPDQRDILDRAGHLMGILKSLELLFPENPELVETWATTRDRALGGATPYEIVAAEGVAGLRDLRAYLDYLRGR